jgi:hypothetical protein
MKEEHGENKEIKRITDLPFETVLRDERKHES